MNKIMYLIDTLEVGGAETSILEISSRLEQWKPVVVSIYKGNSLQDRFEKAGIKVYCLNIDKKFGLRVGLKRIADIIEKERPDLIHATLFRAEQFSRFLGPKFKIPILNSFVNDSYSQVRYKLLNLGQRIVLDLYKGFDRLTAKRVDKFMSITNAIITNNATALNIDPTKVKVIYRGRDIFQLRQKKGSVSITNLKNEFGEGPIILTVSRLLIRKGYLESITAMKQITQKHPSTRYLIAGEGHDRDLLIKLIKKLQLEKYVFLLGSRNDIPSLLNFADIFLFPSHYEGQGGALIEAMIMGKKIVATKIPVLEETVKDNFSAKLFEYRNTRDMAAKIEWAIENPETMEEFAKNALTDAENKFNIHRIAKEHEELYNDMVTDWINKNREKN